MVFDWSGVVDCNPLLIDRMGHSPLCVVWVDWSSSWSSGGELPFCNCVFADWVGICSGGGKITHARVTTHIRVLVTDTMDCNGLDVWGPAETERKTTSLLEE